MRWIPEYKEEIKEKIKSVIVRKPNVSKYELARILGIDKDAALKLKKEVYQENLAKVDNQKIFEEVGKLEDQYEALAFECWEIITKEIRIVKDKKGKEIIITIPVREKLAVIKALINDRKTLFYIKLNAGVFQRKLGDLKPERELSEEEKKLLEQALKYAEP